MVKHDTLHNMVRSGLPATTDDGRRLTYTGKETLSSQRERVWRAEFWAVDDDGHTYVVTHVPVDTYIVEERPGASPFWSTHRDDCFLIAYMPEFQELSVARFREGECRRHHVYNGVRTEQAMNFTNVTASMHAVGSILSTAYLKPWGWQIVLHRHPRSLFVYL